MRFSTGVVTGAILGAAGIAGYAMSDRRTRKRVVRSSRRAFERAGSVFDDLADRF